MEDKERHVYCGGPIPLPIHNCMGLSLVKTLDPDSGVTLFGLNPPTTNSKDSNCEAFFAAH